MLNEFENNVNYLELPLIFEDEHWVGHPYDEGYLESYVFVNQEKFENIFSSFEMPVI